MLWSPSALLLLRDASTNFTYGLNNLSIYSTALRYISRSVRSCSAPFEKSRRGKIYGGRYDWVFFTASGLVEVFREIVICSELTSQICKALRVEVVLIHGFHAIL